MVTYGEFSAFQGGAPSLAQIAVGAFIWTLAQGYLPSNPVGERNPLLTAAAQSILTEP